MYKDGFHSLKDELVMSGAGLLVVSWGGGRVWVRITMGQIGIGLAWRKCNTCGGCIEEDNNGTHAQPVIPNLNIESVCSKLPKFPS